MGEEVIETESKLLLGPEVLEVGRAPGPTFGSVEGIQGGRHGVFKPKSDARLDTESDTRIYCDVSERKSRYDQLAKNKESSYSKNNTLHIY
jgi:hypothetical protein